MVHWLKLKQGVEYYNQRYPHWETSYQKLSRRGQRYWQHLELLDEDTLREEVVRTFLNAWLCRIDYGSCTTLATALKQIPSYYAALSAFRLETVDFRQIIRVRERQLTIAAGLEHVMNGFLGVRPKFGSVASSKLMHMALPNLCVMWDTGIRQVYGVPNYPDADFARWYVRFLQSMQSQLRHAITSLQHEQSSSDEDAVEVLKGLDKGSSLPRQIDKYNFALRDTKQDPCSACPPPKTFF